MTSKRLVPSPPQMDVVSASPFVEMATLQRVIHTPERGIFVFHPRSRQRLVWHRFGLERIQPPSRSPVVLLERGLFMEALQEEDASFAEQLRPPEMPATILLLQALPKRILRRLPAPYVWWRYWSWMVQGDLMREWDALHRTHRDLRSCIGHRAFEEARLFFQRESILLDAKDHAALTRHFVSWWMMLGLFAPMWRDALFPSVEAAPCDTWCASLKLPIDKLLTRNKPSVETWLHPNLETLRAAVQPEQVSSDEDFWKMSRRGRAFESIAWQVRHLEQRIAHTPVSETMDELNQTYLSSQHLNVVSAHKNRVALSDVRTSEDETSTSTPKHSKRKKKKKRKRKSDDNAQESEQMLRSSNEQAFSSVTTEQAEALTKREESIAKQNQDVSKRPESDIAYEQDKHTHSTQSSSRHRTNVAPKPQQSMETSECDLRLHPGWKSPPWLGEVEEDL
ncbi:MAG: hypothetical protein AAGJ35_00530, partial [Myxococcota bacterium]